MTDTRYGRVDPKAVIDNLLALDDESFREIVDDDLRDIEHTGPNAMALRSPALVDRWYSTLAAMSKSVDGQLAARREDWTELRTSLLAEREQLEAELETATQDAADELNSKLRENRARFLREQQKYSKTRAGSLRFRTGLEEWMVEARRLRDATRDRLYDTTVTAERDRYAMRVRTLEEAIANHQKLILEKDEGPTDADTALWDLLS